MRFQPSARIAPPTGRPIRGAVSRLRQVADEDARPGSSGTACAATPSSSQPNVPMPPGAVASATIVDEVGAVAEALVELVRASGSSCPRSDASVPKTRSSSVGWPQLSWTCRYSWRRVEDDREPAGRALRRGRAARRPRRRAARRRRRGRSAADVLVAAPPASRRRSPGSSGAGARRRRWRWPRPPAPTWVIDLLGEAAVGRGERLPLALGGIHRLGEGDALHAGRGLVGGEQVGDLASRAGPRTGPRRSASRSVPWAGGRSSSTAGSRRAVALARAMRTASRGDAVRLRRGQDVAAGEAPRPVDEDADAEPLALARGDALDAAGLDRDRSRRAAGRPGCRRSPRPATMRCRGRARSGLACAAQPSRGMRGGLSGGCRSRATCVGRVASR